MESADLETPGTIFVKTLEESDWTKVSVMMRTSVTLQQEKATHFESPFLFIDLKRFLLSTDRPIPLPLDDVTQLTTSSPSLPVDAPAAPSQAHAYSTTAGSQPRPPEDVQDYVPKTDKPRQALAAHEQSQVA